MAGACHSVKHDKVIKVSLREHWILEVFKAKKTRLLNIRAIVEVRTDIDTTVDLIRKYPHFQRLWPLGLYKGP